MISRYCEVVKGGLTIKSLINYISWGRKILDVNMKPGGFGRYLAGEELGKI